MLVDNDATYIPASINETIPNEGRGPGLGFMECYPSKPMMVGATGYPIDYVTSKKVDGLNVVSKTNYRTRLRAVPEVQMCEMCLRGKGAPVKKRNRRGCSATLERGGVTYL
ncbi:hypothetical protein Y032_0008g89 [Ancylostoma ceylanicum]|uniref:Uncharacterized protein n=1 Tax=Ancylostoma ceylanicum TaxID=53326 RepID=A0A016VLL0_9BILA|nr:hypothetical protein Y032_0008g89 [Ancylostoma ceylanicum]